MSGSEPAATEIAASTAPINELEAELERVKRVWSRLAERHARLESKVERNAAGVERALSEYEQAWQTLEDARREAGLPSEPESEAAKPWRLSRADEATTSQPSPQAPKPESPVSLSEGNFDELRTVGMSITQARRIIRYRETHGDFTAVDELEQVPGIPKKLLAQIKEYLAP